MAVQLEAFLCTYINARDCVGTSKQTMCPLTVTYEIIFPTKLSERSKCVGGVG